MIRKVDAILSTSMCLFMWYKSYVIDYWKLKCSMANLFFIVCVFTLCILLIWTFKDILS